MKVIIAGGRGITDPKLVSKAIEDSGFEVSEVVCGGATGVDTLGRFWAKCSYIPCKLFVPDWDTHGKAAGPIRNKAMAEYADALILVWDGRSRGSANMKRQAEQRGLPIYEVIVP